MNTKLDFETINMLSKGITQFAFHSGPIKKSMQNINLRKGEFYL